ncbi:hypothetical protein CEK62_07595 [Alcanivorax sp. N3-2A]|nr:hypothetical protein CEK62_07595 [Alcanivorax sp. N3-2A]|tara:strand:- start:26483 stop:27226 length:744 start_codon:yes stop_codon:yes gene_type:complete
MSRLRSPLALLCLSLCLALATPLQAQMSIHIIQRSDAAALVPVIEPLVPADGYVNAYQGKLIIRTTEANFDEILAALGDMPDAPRTVVVHFRRAGSTESSAAGAGIQQGRITLGATGQRGERQDHYQISTLTGHAAGISQGTLVALSGTYYPALVSLKQGIRVTPQMTADGRVRLSIEQRFDEPPDARGHARTQGSSSTLMLTPGQWQPLGAISVSERDSAAGLGSVRVQTRQAELPLEVKVEVKGL